MSTTTDLSQEEINSFADNGYLILRNLLTSSETKHLQKWAQEIHDLPRTPEVPWMPYEVNNLPSCFSSTTSLISPPLSPLKYALRSTHPHRNPRKSTPPAPASSAAPKTSPPTTPASTPYSEARASSASSTSSPPNPCSSSKRRSTTSSPAAAASRPTSTQPPTRTSGKSNTSLFSSPLTPPRCETAAL